jgi:integrase
VRQSVKTFGELWWQTRIGHRVSTRARDRLILDHDLYPVLGDMVLTEVSHSDVAAWVASLSARLAPASVRRAFTIVDQLLDAAVDAGHIPANPAARVRLPRIERTETRFLTPDELEQLAAGIDPAYRAMVLVMAWATLRIGEAAGLRRSDVDFATGSIRVANNVVEVGSKQHEGPPKTRAGQRTMTLPASVAAELARHLELYAERHYVFPHPHGRVLRAGEWRRRIWRPALAASGLGPLRVHDLKHSGVAYLAAAGVDPSEIARRAGHASVAFTYDRYGHLLPEMDKAAAAKLDQLRLRHDLSCLANWDRTLDNSSDKALDGIIGP